MKKLTFKYVNDGKITSIIVNDADRYIHMMRTVMTSTPIEVISVVDATELEAASERSQSAYFAKYGTACE